MESMVLMMACMAQQNSILQMIHPLRQLLPMLVPALLAVCFCLAKAPSPFARRGRLCVMNVKVSRLPTPGRKCRIPACMMAEVRYAATGRAYASFEAVNELLELVVALALRADEAHGVEVEILQHPSNFFSTRWRTLVPKLY